MTLGKKICQLREELGMSQAVLSAEAGLSQGYVSQLENDEVQNPSASVILRLGRALHVDPTVLMEAAGYKDFLQESNQTPLEFEVLPELVRFLARHTSDQQTAILLFLQSQKSDLEIPPTGVRSETRH